MFDSPTEIDHSRDRLENNDLLDGNDDENQSCKDNFEMDHDGLNPEKQKRTKSPLETSLRNEECAEKGMYYV